MKPLVGVVCDRFFVGEHDLHSVKQSYVRALTSCAHVSPVLIPPRAISNRSRIISMA